MFPLYLFGFKTYFFDIISDGKIFTWGQKKSHQKGNEGLPTLLKSPYTFLNECHLETNGYATIAYGF